MHETAADLDSLQRLLERSYELAGPHLRSVITPERRLTAGELAARLTGIRLLTLATTTQAGAPVTGAVDGIFYRGEFWFGTSPTALRIRHIRERPQVSATHLPGEELAVTVHGAAHVEGAPAELPAGFRKVCVEVYGEGWLEWGKDAVYCRIEAERMFTFCLPTGGSG